MLIKKTKNNKGFTLIEVMVSSSIFIIVMLIVSGAVAGIMAANRKSISMRSSMDNLDVALRDMTKTISFGKIYHCSNTTPPSLTSSLDCPGGSSILNLKDQSGYSITYSLVTGRITRTDSNTGATTYLTSTDINITNLKFIVSGSDPFVSGSGVTCSTTDCYQPKVLIAMSGTVGTGGSQSSFSLETLVTQRLFDFQ